MVKQADALAALLTKIVLPTINSRALSEICYTATETGIIEDGICGAEALEIWALVELAKKITEEQVSSIKM